VAVEPVGWVAAALTTLSFVPQVVRTLRTRDVSGISVPMYAAFCLGVAIWIVYGVMTASPPVIAANVVTLTLAGAVLALTLRLRAP
jgi:MtN3 and saliva related transmembrane protein